MSLRFFFFVNCENIGICFLIIFVKLVGVFLNEIFFEFILEKFNMLLIIFRSVLVFCMVIDVSLCCLEFNDEFNKVFSIFCIL